MVTSEVRDILNDFVLATGARARLWSELSTTCAARPWYALFTYVCCSYYVHGSHCDARPVPFSLRLSRLLLGHSIHWDRNTTWDMLFPSTHDSNVKTQQDLIVFCYAQERVLIPLPKTYEVL